MLFNVINSLDLWLSIIAVMVAIVALFQTNIQIKLSNKQQLFNRRLEKYLLIKELLSLYSENRNLIIHTDDICESVEFMFAWLTNSSTLESMCLAMENPLKHEEQKIFLTKCEMLEKSAMEIELIWRGKVAHIMGHFVRQYKELLQAMYRQQIMLDGLYDEREKEPIPLERAQEKIHKKAEEFGLFSCVEGIEKTYQEIIKMNAEEYLKKSMKL